MRLSDIILNEDCGCNKEPQKVIVLKEQVENISEGLKYHIDNQVPLHENIYRPASDFYFSLFKESRELLKKGILEVGDIDREMLETTDIGRHGNYKGIKVPLDFPLTHESLMVLKEAKYHGKEVQLGKVHRGGSRKFYVFVKNPSTGNVKKISFGDTTGLRIKIKNPKARKAFAARHKCSQANDRLSRRYWACRLPRYLPGSSFTGFW
jgi:hypothetical protein